MRNALVLNTPISTKITERLFPTHWSVNTLTQFVWLGGITTGYKTSWPHKRTPQLRLRFWRRRLSSLFEALDYEPAVLAVRDSSDLLSVLSQSNQDNQANHVLFHIENETRRYWLFLDRIDSQLCLFDGQSNHRMSANQFIQEADNLSVVLVPKSLFMSVSSADVTHMALRLQAEHMRSETGPLNEISTWLTALKRPSLRLSWNNLLAHPEDYFWIAVQLGAQLRGFSSSDGFDGHRLAYANALVGASAILKLPMLRQLALDVRRAGEGWQIIQDIMLMASSTHPSSALNEARMLLLSGASPQNPLFKTLAAKFVEEGGIHDVSFRIRAIENKLQMIKEIEYSVAQQLQSCLQGCLETIQQDSAAS